LHPLSHYPTQSTTTDKTPHSRQIRPPIYSLKQTKLRKRRVVRYAILYFSLFLLFIILIVGPIIASKFIDTGSIKLPMNLVQPNNWNNNDTTASDTGTAVAKAAAATAGAVGAGSRLMFSF